MTLSQANQSTQHDRVGSEWLEEIRIRFPEEFEDTQTDLDCQQSIEEVPGAPKWQRTNEGRW